MKAPPCFDDAETKKIIRSICTQHSIDSDLLKDLCEMVIERSGAGRRFGLDEEIAGIIERFFSREAQS